MPRRSDTLDGYVLDNMEGSVDQVGFLAHTDTPVAIAGARGIGKAYVARIFHTCTGCRPDTRAPVECREFRNRGDAKRRN
ncbi:MAG: sigma 54-interacting transcriptional regulator [Haliea sp.]|nr:sigma 54-interacting transcriptional regulator [Haliea sp.]